MYTAISKHVKRFMKHACLECGRAGVLLHLRKQVPPDLRARDVHVLLRLQRFRRLQQRPRGPEVLVKLQQADHDVPERLRAEMKRLVNASGYEAGLPDFSWYMIPNRKKCTK
jgi:hypothetical protein